MHILHLTYSTSLICSKAWCMFVLTSYMLWKLMCWQGNLGLFQLNRWVQLKWLLTQLILAPLTSDFPCNTLTTATLLKRNNILKPEILNNLVYLVATDINMKETTAINMRPSQLLTNISSMVKQAVSNCSSSWVVFADISQI